MRIFVNGTLVYDYAEKVRNALLVCVMVFLLCLFCMHVVCFQNHPFNINADLYELLDEVKNYFDEKNPCTVRFLKISPRRLLYINLLF